MNRIVSALIGLVAVAAGVLAWDATTTTAQATHAVTPSLAWLVPLILEVGCVVLGFRAFVIARREGQRALTERAAVIALFALSLLGQTLAAAPVVVLVLAVESLLRGAHKESESDEEKATAGTADTPATPASPAAAAPANNPTPPASEGMRGGRETPSTPETVLAEPIHLVTKPEVRKRAYTKREDRERILRELRAEHGDVLNGTHVAQALGVSPSQGRRILAAHKTKEVA